MLWRFNSRSLGAGRLDSGCFRRTYFDARCFFTCWFFHARRWSGLGHRIAVDLRLRVMRLSLALHLQPVLLQLLRIERLLRTLVLLCVLRPRSSALRTIAPVGAASATAATIASPAARLFAILPRRAIAVLGDRIRTLLRGRPRWLLRTRGTLIGAALRLRRPFGSLSFRLR